MTKHTTRHNLPYPESGDPVYLGASQMQALAEAVDAVVGTGGGGGGQIPADLLERLETAENQLAAATPAATEDTIVKRNATGNASVALPTQDGHIATKRYVDQAVAAGGGGGDTDWRNDPIEVIDLSGEIISPWSLAESGNLSLVRSGGWMILRVSGLTRPEGTWGNVTSVVIPDDYRPDVPVSGHLLAGGNGDPAEVRAQNSGRVYVSSVVAGQTYSGAVVWPVPSGSPVPTVEGPPGEPGNDGQSAYQVAVDNGFTGTPAQWLASLKGAKGDPGKPGDKGDPGQPGTTPDLSPIRTELFGAANRTRAAVAEIAVTNNITSRASTDQLAQASWGALVDTDNGLIVSGTYGQTRYTIPVSGRWSISYQLVHDNRNGGGSLKVLVDGQDVLRHSIASTTGTSSLEGPTMSLYSEYVFTQGQQVRWAYWHQYETIIVPQKFGSVKSKIVLRWIGPR